MALDATEHVENGKVFDAEGRLAVRGGAPEAGADTQNGYLVDSDGRLYVVGPNGAEVITSDTVPTITSGTANPSASEPNGSTYYQEDAAGQTIAVWSREGGAWGKVLGAGPRFHGTQSGLSATSGSNTNLTYDAEVVDTDSMGDGTNLVTIPRAGVYSIHGFVIWPGSATNSGYRRLEVLKTGTVIVAADSRNATTTANVSTQIPIATEELFSVGQQLWLRTFHTQGATLTITGHLKVRWVSAS